MPVWPWTLAYAALALPFVPFWVDFETARRGLGIALGGAALLALAWLPRRGQATHGALPSGALLAGLGLLTLHLLSGTFAPNPQEALQRTLWLTSLAAVAALAAARSEPLTHLRAVWPIGLVVAGFGVAQALGVAWPVGYSFADDPVSTLGNRNVAAEFCSVVTVGSALLWLRQPRSAGALLAVLFGVAYLWLNHSRGALLATGLTLVPLILAPARPHPRPRRLWLGVTLLLGLGLGHTIRLMRPQQPEAATVSAAATTPPPDAAAAPSTLAVRLEIWSAGLKMVASAPLLGVGAGQFKVLYPLYRTDAEIEMSSRGRQFATATLSAHHDPLEIAIETGLLGLGLAIACVATLIWPVRRSALLAPFLAFLLLGLSRSPLGNAPCAVLAMAVAGALARREVPSAQPSLWWRIALCLLALALGVQGARETAGQCAAAPHVAAQRTPPEQRQWLVQLHALDSAVAWCPWDASLRAAQARLRFRLAAERGDEATLRGLVAERGDLTALLALAPHSTGNQLFAAEVLARTGDHAAAVAKLEAVLRQDPPNPEARVFLATERALRADVRGAIDTLYAGGAPHAQLRQTLAQNLAELSAQVQDSSLRQQLVTEAAFIAALDGLASAPDAEATVRQIQSFAQQARRDDLRAVALLALGMLRSSDPAVRAEAENAVRRVADHVKMTPVHARLCGKLLEPLRAFPAWRERLPPP